jgi:anaerobic magnesium-protoporphyrin IX monomethyl ester cyclase
MARFLLVNPPSSENLGAPLLGLSHVAAAALAQGAEVRVIDAAARHFEHDDDWIVREAAAFAPDVIGVALFTRWVLPAYRLAARLADLDALLVAGGAHATILPEETLERGFDVAVVGEAEVAIRRLLDAVDAGGPLDGIPGVVLRAADGGIRRGPPGDFIRDLDALPMPQTAADLFDAAWYDDGGGGTAPGGVLTSRGCPARCTFCANYVTGRKFRHRSPANVVEELSAWHRRTGQTFFPFWDDALTADRRRLAPLCRAFREDLDFDLTWSAITRANHVTPEHLRTMRDAGANYGVESGDAEILAAIRKGVTTDQVERALEWSKELGLRTATNFMLGFPQETPAALERTLRFMERIAPLVDTFSTLGVVVPFPGTPIYEDFHEEYGFTRWWLDERCLNYEAPPPVTDADRFYRHYIDDRNLDLDFFGYSDGMRDLIRECLRFKAEHNLKGMGLLADPIHRPEPVG